MDMYAPPIPARQPAMRRAMYLYFMTFKPTDFAALSFSPTARIRSPTVVFQKKTVRRITRISPR